MQTRKEMVARATIGGNTTATSLRKSRTLRTVGDRVFLVVWVVVEESAVSQGKGDSRPSEEGIGETNPSGRAMLDLGCNPRIN